MHNCETDTVSGNFESDRKSDGWEGRIGILDAISHSVVTSVEYIHQTDYMLTGRYYIGS
jgi:hypothetical protein